ncbi:hypothetical protein ABRQ22_01910 [Cellulosimicrobium sp. ES-005]|uniref:Transposase n=1 Tax=Cellulosimicrobium sp. ES-005 TaxID=3163031 RepID=A0AAU8G2V7_9MICO
MPVTIHKTSTYLYTIARDRTGVLVGLSRGKARELTTERDHDRARHEASNPRRHGGQVLVIADDGTATIE